MIENYYIHPCGVLRQEYSEPFTYDEEYLKTYESYPTEELSQLRFTHMTKFLFPQSVTDIGCGDGAFLRFCDTMRVKDLYGYDLAPPTAMAFEPIKWYKVGEKYGFEYKKTRCPGERKVDLTVMYDSLEHMPDIGRAISEVNSEYLIISVPCYHDHLPDEWFENWHHRKPDEHLWHFSPGSLVAFMNRMGWDVLSLSNVEDEIRVGKTPNVWNIMTGVLRQRNSQRLYVSNSSSGGVLHIEDHGCIHRPNS